MPSLGLAEYSIFNIYLDWRVTAAPVDTDTGKYNQETVDTAALHCTVCTQATVLISGPYKVPVSPSTTIDYLSTAPGATEMPADSHIGLAVVFDVPEGEDTAAHRANFYAKSRAGTKELLYYGFAGLGNKVMCRADM